MDLIGVHEHQGALRGADPDGTIRVPFEWEAAKDRWRTPDHAAVAVGPIALKAGDVLDLRLAMQYANDNTFAKGFYTAPQGYANDTTKQSEHWTLPVMGASGMRINSGLTWDNSEWCMPQHEENFDNIRHYQQVDRAWFYKVTRDWPAAFLFSRTYFVASKAYFDPARWVKMRIVGGGYTHLQIGHLR